MALSRWGGIGMSLACSPDCQRVGKQGRCAALQSPHAVSGQGWQQHVKTGAHQCGACMHRACMLQTVHRCACMHEPRKHDTPKRTEHRCPLTSQHTRVSHSTAPCVRTCKRSWRGSLLVEVVWWCRGWGGAPQCLDHRVCICHSCQLHTALPSCTHPL